MKLVFATNNKNKIKEVQKLIPEHLSLLSLEDIGCFEDIPETKDTIEGNALQKAQYVKSHYGYDCFADDTGLEVSALNGAPGVYSARYAGEEKNAEANMQKLLSALSEKNNRTAQFKTVIALILNNETTLLTGICKGEIINKKRGDGGFGYDPIFKPEGFDETFGEMDLDLKNRIGHRGKATKKLLDHLSNKFQ
ncbi:non-canonical purine NTP diphosphatase [Gaetbulibacter sp. M240]|uniref:non-canonical purine NTP diphosphatase n=1 Tax=Gaetbulibacter sp. M240 TaxID=3126511 RepID=UPI00374FB5EF